MLRPQHSSLRFDQGSTHALQLPGPIPVHPGSPGTLRHDPKRQKSEQGSVELLHHIFFPKQSPGMIDDEHL